MADTKADTNPPSDEDKKTAPAPKVDEKQYGTFKAMLTRFISEHEDDEKETPKRTTASEDKPKPSILSTLFGGE